MVYWFMEVGTPNCWAHFCCILNSKKVHDIKYRVPHRAYGPGIWHSSEKKATWGEETHSVNKGNS